jgi:hypothetical protein
LPLYGLFLRECGGAASIARFTKQEGRAGFVSAPMGLGGVPHDLEEASTTLTLGSQAFAASARRYRRRRLDDHGREPQAHVVFRASATSCRQGQCTYSRGSVTPPLPRLSIFAKTRAQLHGSFAAAARSHVIKRRSTLERYRKTA